MDARTKTAAALLFTTLALANATPSVLAQDPLRDVSAEQATDVRVARLVRNLGSPSFNARSAADRELSDLGTAARKQIEIASRSSDPEVRMRASRLLRRLKVAAMWHGSSVDLQATDVTAEQIVEQLRKQTGNRIAAGDQYGAFRPGKVSLAAGEQTFWQVVDQVCHQTENRFRPNYGSGPAGWVLVAGESGNYPVAYAGPVRARITSARRLFVEEFNYRDGKSDVSHTLQMNMRLSWEDRFRLVAYRSQLEVARGLDDQGGETTGVAVAEDDWSLFEGGRHQLKMAVRLRPPQVSAKQLQTLTLRWPVIAVGDMATLETENMAEEKSFQQGDASLVIEQTRQRGSQWEVTVSVTRDLAVPEPREILFLENEFELVDDEGESHRAHNTTKLGITGSTARLKLIFATNSPGRKASQLRMHFPQIRDERDLMIPFRDVPLPRAEPE